MFFLTPSVIKVKDLLDTRHAIAAGKSPIGVNPLLKYDTRSTGFFVELVKFLCTSVF